MEDETKIRFEELDKRIEIIKWYIAGAASFVTVIIAVVVLKLQDGTSKMRGIRLKKIRKL